MTFNAVKTELESYLFSKNLNKINTIGKLSLNEWKGQKNVEFIIDDISVNKTINNLVPSSNGWTDGFQSSNQGSIPRGTANNNLPRNLMLKIQ